MNPRGPRRTMVTCPIVAALLATAGPLTAATVELSVTERQGVGRREEPVTFGVPLPKGALRSAEQARLLRGGREVPAQFRATGLWYPDRSVRWLLVDFQTDIEAGSRQDYILEYGEGVSPRAKPPASIRIAESEDAFSVDTGSASFRIGKRAFDLFEEVRLEDGTVVVPRPDTARPRPGAIVRGLKPMVTRAIPGAANKGRSHLIYVKCAPQAGLEDYTLRFTSPRGYEVTGARSGPAGSGAYQTDFISKDGLVSIPADAWLAYAYPEKDDGYTFRTIPEGHATESAEVSEATLLERARWQVKSCAFDGRPPKHEAISLWSSLFYMEALARYAEIFPDDAAARGYLLAHLETLRKAADPRNGILYTIAPQPDGGVTGDGTCSHYNVMAADLLAIAHRLTGRKDDLDAARACFAYGVKNANGKDGSPTYFQVHSANGAMHGNVFMAVDSSSGENREAAPGESSPATWLPAAGRSDEWKAGTDRCRGLLGKLDPRDALVRENLPKMREKAQLVLRSPGLDWKAKTAVEYLENMLEDLIAGRKPHGRYAGKEFGYPYWSNTMERIEAIWIHVPPGYDPARTYQFFLYYKCGGGIHLKDGRPAGGYRPTAEVANKSDTFHAWSSLDIQVKGRKGAHIEVEEATAALCRDFSIDPDRIFLTGWSDGGFTAIWVASRYPHLVAGIAPACGNWQYTNIEDVGLSNVPTLAVDGWGDGGYNGSQFCRWLALRGLGADARCIWGHHGHSYQPYEDVEEFRYILDWAKGKRRDLYPKKIRYATWNLAWNRAYWLAIDRVESPVLAARFEAEVTGDNIIQVQAGNIAAYRLALTDKLVDPRRPVTVVTNGKPSYSGPFLAELPIELSPRPAGKFVKDATLPDDIATAVIESSYATPGSSAIPSRRWLAVRPTGWDEETACALARWIPRDARADGDLTDRDMAEHHLLIYGGPDINKLAARIAPDLPVKFDRGRFTVGGKVFDGPTNCVAFIHPNPLNPMRYVSLYAFNDAESFAGHGFFGMTGGSFSEFRAGDCLVSGLPVEHRPWGTAMDSRSFETRHLIFDAAWKADASPPLGKLERAFDYPQFLRLKADAMREATGADVGVIWEHTPPWNRWGDSLPAGPVTLHDLATIDMLPENIGIAEMTGAELLHSRPSATTLVADRRDPAHDGKVHLSAADIDPARTYRVAMGYFGMPSYGAEPDRMPKLFPFVTPEDFLAVRTDSLALKDFRQLPTQVIEATAQYIRKHGRVSPRPVCFDLTEYIMDPEDNEYGACDWLHLAVEAPWKGAWKGADAGRGDRYTLNLGLRAAGEPEAAPPRGNSKRFLDLDVTAKGASFTFAELDKKLPVAVTMTARRHTIAAKETEGYRLAGAEAIDGVVGRCLLVNLRLANAGPDDVAGTAIISASELRQVWRQTWPDEEDKEFRGHYAGYHRARGEERKPPEHEDAALLLFAGEMPKTPTLIAPNAGYNFGLAGVSAPVALKAGSTLSLRLLLVAFDRPPGANVGLAQVLDALREDLTRNQE